MELYKFTPRDYFGSNTYLIVSDGEAALVDPSVTYDEVSTALDGARLKYILLTHCHFDHILKINEWVEKTSAEVLIGDGDRGGLASPITNCYGVFLGVEDGYFGRVTSVFDGDKLTVGSATVKVISTPGHTAGGVSYLARDVLFVGDTVFAGGGYGRCDLPGGDEAILFASIHKLCDLHDNVKVCAGHGEDTAVSEIKMNFK